MKSPHCPSCGKSHWSTQRCGAKDSGSPAKPARSPQRREQGRESPTDPSEGNSEGAAEKQLQGSASGIVTPGQDQSGKSVGVAPDPLTPAAKQKKYREKRGDAYREANKLRMRKKRDV